MRLPVVALISIVWSVLLGTGLYLISYPPPERVVIEIYKNVCGPIYETHIPREYEFGS